LQDHTYYAPTAGPTERTIESTRFPESVEERPNVAVWSSDAVTLKLTFAQQVFAVGMGPSKPFPMPVLPVWLLIWNGPGPIDPPTLFVDVATNSESVSIDFSQFRLFVPAHGGSEQVEAVSEIVPDQVPGEQLECSPMQTVLPNSQREFVLRFPPAGHPQEIELRISGLSVASEPVRTGTITFERTHDAILY
jgi:hypothetical protein